MNLVSDVIKEKVIPDVHPRISVCNLAASRAKGSTGAGQGMSGHMGLPCILAPDCTQLISFEKRKLVRPQNLKTKANRKARMGSMAKSR